jgi:hypothetical protein
MTSDEAQQTPDVILGMFLASSHPATVTPTFCKNKNFCANWSAYKNAYQIIVLAKNFPK